MPAVSKCSLPQTALVRESGAAIESQRSLVVLFDADPYPVQPPALEACFQDGFQSVFAKSLAPTTGVYEERKLD